MGTLSKIEKYVYPNYIKHAATAGKIVSLPHLGTDIEHNGEVTLAWRVNHVYN